MNMRGERAPELLVLLNMTHRAIGKESIVFFLADGPTLKKKKKLSTH